MGPIMRQPDQPLFSESLQSAVAEPGAISGAYRHRFDHQLPSCTRCALRAPCLVPAGTRNQRP
jgi:hypothetical protein